MPNAEVFTVKDNIQMQFESRGKQYFMKLNITEGMVLLYEVKDSSMSSPRVIFIDEPSKTYETVAREVASEPSIESSEQEVITTTPKHKKKRKKK